MTTSTTSPPSQPPPQPQQPRSVARPVSNLGNTCYMNAVLQALAHAPELCLAMDCAPHHLTCPVAAENALKRKSGTTTTTATCNKNSPSTSPENNGASAAIVPDAPSQSQAPPTTTTTTTLRKQQPGTRKSARRTGAAAAGRKSPRTAANAASSSGGTGTGGGDADSANSSDNVQDMEFCALCEVEHHIRRVHDINNNASSSSSNKLCRDKPVAPTAFVRGFIDHVAPWFQLGVQEDSHEFLRLLIDAMQKSCQRARLQENPQDVSPRGKEGEEQEHNVMDEDNEYPFSLFRGTVESNVVCESCKASSSTLDPIEDVGLEVTLPHQHHQQPPFPSSFSRNNNNNSRNTSPIPAASSSALSDVQTAFQRFAQTEALDSGYKCDTCGKVGRATKQSRLASIPPILTLHLKRFRYGDRGGDGTALAAATRRSCRSSEVSQLLGSNGNNNFSGGGDFSTGKSGSAKIEGHIKFDMFFDLKPYLTDELKAKHKNMFCRLFAVIVHAGKNSHSGHYIAFVRNVSQNEWWKMDDSRVTAVTVEEVMQAEAYMLLYRVVQHPVAVQLEELHKKKVQIELDNSSCSIAVATTVAASAAAAAAAVTADNRKRRPSAEVFETGEEWARKTNFPPHLMGLIQKMTDLLADEIQITAPYYKTICEEAALQNAAIGKGPLSSKIGDGDVVGGTEKYARMVYELLYKLKDHPSAAKPWLASLFNDDDLTASTTTTTTTNEKSATDTSEKRVAVEEPDETAGLL